MKLTWIFKDWPVKASDQTGTCEALHLTSRGFLADVTYVTQGGQWPDTTVLTMTVQQYVSISFDRLTVCG